LWISAGSNTRQLSIGKLINQGNQTRVLGLKASGKLQLLQRMWPDSKDS
jgi:hypothetical protein